MRRAAGLFLSLAMLLSLCPAAAAEEEAQEGLSITWYPQYGSLTVKEGTERMIVSNDSGLYALSDLYGNLLTGFIFDAFRDFEDGAAHAMVNGKWGSVDINGKTIKPFSFTDESALDAEITKAQIVRKGGMFAVADMSGKLLTDYKYWNARDFYNGYAAVQDDQQRWGYVDETGREVIPCRYYSGGVEDFQQDGLAVVYGTEFREIDGELEVVSSGYNIVDATGRELLLSPSYLKPWRAGKGLIGYGSTDLVGFIDAESGKSVIPCRYGYMTDPKGYMYGNLFNTYGVASVYSIEENRWGGIDTEGRTVIPFISLAVVQFDTDGVGAVTLAEGDYESGDFEYVTQYYDMHGTLREHYIPTWWRTGPEYHEGLAMVSQNGKYAYGGTGSGDLWGCQDESGKLVVSYAFDGVGHFENGFAAVLKDGVYGLLKNPLNADKISPWAQADVDRSRELGLVTERTGRYDTYNITRLQFAELMVNLVEKATGKAAENAAPDRFTDTTDPAALKAAALNIVSGTGDGSTFSPDALITREQLAVMLYRAMGVILWERDGLGFTPVPTDLSAFSDGAQVSSWAAAEVSQMARMGILKGSGGAVSPKGYTTVEQAILTVLRLYEHLGGTTA